MENIFLLLKELYYSVRDVTINEDSITFTYKTWNRCAGTYFVTKTLKISTIKRKYHKKMNPKIIERKPKTKREEIREYILHCDKNCYDGGDYIEGDEDYSLYLEIEKELEEAGLICIY